MNILGDMYRDDNYVMKEPKKVPEKNFNDLLDETKDVMAPTVNTLDKDYAGELSRRFISRYKDSINEINTTLTKVYNENNQYQIPVPTLSLEEGKGFTESVDQLAEPAVMATRLVKHQEINYVLRVGIPWGTVQEVYNDGKYFDEFFDTLMKSSYQAVIKRYGQPKYGDFIFSPDRPDGRTRIFTDNGDGLEIRFHGKFAGGPL